MVPLFELICFLSLESCEAMTINLKKTTNLLRLVVLDVLKAALDSLAKSPRHEKDSHLVTFICAAGVTYVDSYRTMKLAYQTATNEHDETGVSTPIGQWYAMTFKKEAKKIGRKNKRLQSLYNECAIAGKKKNRRGIARKETGRRRRRRSARHLNRRSA